MAPNKRQRTQKAAKAIITGTIMATTTPCYIDNLLDDNLIQIFMLLYALWPSKDYENRSELAVCRRWRNLILDTPLLWTKIHVPNIRGRECSYNNQSYERSRGALLDLIVWQGSNKPGSNGSLITDLLVQHQTRIRTLTINSGPDFAAASVFSSWDSPELQMNTPYLNTIKIETFHTAVLRCFMLEQWRPAVEDCGIGLIASWPGISSLTTLVLDGFEARSFPSAPNVRVLQLGAAELTPKALKDILDRFPSLGTLAVAELEPLSPASADANSHDGATIYANSLRKLGFGSYHGHGAGCGCGLAFLAAPNLEYLELQCKSGLLGHRHFTTLLHPDNTKHLRKIRLGSRAGLLSRPAIKFLRKVRCDTIDLQISWLVGPEWAHESLQRVLESVSMRSIIVDFAFAKTWWSFRAKKNANEMVTVLKDATKASPTFIRGLTHDTLSLQELGNHLEGSGVTILRSKTEDWLVPLWDGFCEDHSDNEEESDSDGDYTYFDGDSDEEMDYVEGEDIDHTLTLF